MTNEALLKKIDCLPRYVPPKTIAMQGAKTILGTVVLENPVDTVNELLPMFAQMAAMYCWHSCAEHYPDMINGKVNSEVVLILNQETGSIGFARAQFWEAANVVMWIKPDTTKGVTRMFTPTHWAYLPQGTPDFPIFHCR